MNFYIALIAGILGICLGFLLFHIGELLIKYMYLTLDGGLYERNDSPVYRTTRSNMISRRRRRKYECEFDVA